MSFVNKSKTKFAPKIKRRAQPKASPLSKAESASEKVSEQTPSSHIENTLANDSQPFNDDSQPFSNPEDSLIESTLVSTQPTSQPKDLEPPKLKSHIIKAPDTQEIFKKLSSTSRRSSVNTATTKSRRLSSMSTFNNKEDIVIPERKRQKIKKNNRLEFNEKGLLTTKKKSGIISINSLSMTEEFLKNSEVESVNNELENENEDDERENFERQKYYEFRQFLLTRPWKPLPTNYKKKERVNEAKDAKEYMNSLVKSLDTQVDEVDKDLAIEKENVEESANPTTENEKIMEPIEKDNPENPENPENLEKNDDESSEEIQLVVDPLSKKIKAINKEDYERFKDFFDKEQKLTSLKQIPRGIDSINQELMKNFVIDEEQFTLADLCNFQLPVGKVSSDFKLAKEAQAKRAKEVVRKRVIRKEARKNGISYKKVMEMIEDPKLLNVRREQDVANLFNNSAEHQSLQLSMVDGKMVIKDGTEILDNRRNLSNVGKVREVENENPFEKPINSRSFSKNFYSDRWDFKETARFYKLLSTWGTDFQIISQLFPHRDRRQIKQKFTLEEKRNGHLVDLALKQKLPLNFDEYVENVNKDKKASQRKKFKSLEEFNRELELEKAKHENHLKIIIKAKEEARLEDIDEVNKKEEDRKRNAKLSLKQQKIQLMRSEEEVIGEI